MDVSVGFLCLHILKYPVNIVDICKILPVFLMNSAAYTHALFNNQIRLGILQFGGIIIFISESSPSLAKKLNLTSPLNYTLAPVTFLMSLENICIIPVIGLLPIFVLVCQCTNKTGINLPIYTIYFFRFAAKGL